MAVTKIEFDAKDEEILEIFFSLENVIALLEDYEESSVRQLMEKVGLDFPEELETEEEEPKYREPVEGLGRDEEEEDGVEEDE